MKLSFKSDFFSYLIKLNFFIIFIKGKGNYKIQQWIQTIFGTTYCFTFNRKKGKEEEKEKQKEGEKEISRWQW